MADSTLTPAEIARIGAIVAPIVYERSVAPGLAARYDGACESVVRLHDETVAQRQRIAALEDELEAARAQLAAATWPFRATRRLADDARPTTEGSEQ